MGFNMGYLDKEIKEMEQRKKVLEEELERTDRTLIQLRCENGASV